MLTIPAALGSGVPMAEGDGGGYQPPTISEFFPPQVIGEGTFWGLTRIDLIAVFMTGVICLFFISAFRKPSLIPGKLQNVGEMALDVVYDNVINEVMGVKGRKYAPLLVTLFWVILAFNVTGLLPMMHIAVNSVVGFPIVFAISSYVAFNYAGIKEHGVGQYLKQNLFPPGVPKPIYVLVTPIEFISTFLLRPVTLTIRLLANMMSGHLLLVLFFGATSYFLFESSGLIQVAAVPSYLMGLIFVFFEVVVTLLQAYIFTLLTAVYIDGALSHEH